MKFKSDIEVQAGLKDSSGSAGTSGQILSSTASGVSWINQISLSGYVPYTGATTNVDLGTHTLLANDLVINHSSGSGVAASITKGGNGEALTINKTSGSGNAMSVTGGLTSLVDLTLSSITNATTDTDKFIVSDSGLIKYRTGAEVLSDIGGQAALTNPITGTGTTNYVSKFTSTSTLGDSLIYDNGTNVGIGTTTPSTLLQVGNVNSSSDLVSLGVSYNTSRTTRGGIVWRDSTNITGRIHTEYDGTMISMQFGSLYNSGYNANPLMTIRGNGNVGIGTTSPTYKLHVVGEGYFSSNLTANNIYATQVCNTSTCNNASIALTSSGVRITRNIADSNTAFAVTQTNASSTGAIQTWNNSAGEKMRVTQSGRVGLGTTNPSHLLDVNGTSMRLGDGIGSDASIYFDNGPQIVSSPMLGYFKSGNVYTNTMGSGYVGIGQTSPSALLDVAGDALINSITVGRGGGNDNSNTVVGRNSFANNSSGTENTVIGANAGNDIATGNANVIIGKGAAAHIDGGDGNTIIGTNNSLPPTTAPTDFSDTLSISKGESNFGVYLPHIWAPANVATSSTATIISANVGAYRAMFVEYVIEDENGNIRGGYIKGIWNSDLSVIKMTEDTTSSIGTTSNYVFDIVDDGSSNAALQITSLSTDIVYCAVTSRLLTRVY